MQKDIRTVLSIAGSDSCGGAGIQADIKTCCAFGVYASTAITALTAQNTMGVEGIELTRPEFVAQQIDSVVKDIRPDAVKIGMLGSAQIAHAVAEVLRECKLKNIVIDPVMVASSGSSLSGNRDDLTQVILKELAPLATLITPNAPEMATLLGMPLDYEDPPMFSLRLMGVAGCNAVLLKGGHFEGETSTDYLTWRNGDGELKFAEFNAPRISTPNSHGTGCTLSTAIACGLAAGLDLETAVGQAKDFVTEALKGSRVIKLGKGTGPLDFFARKQ